MLLHSMAVVAPASGWPKRLAALVEENPTGDFESMGSRQTGERGPCVQRSYELNRHPCSMPPSFERTRYWGAVMGAKCFRGKLSSKLTARWRRRRDSNPRYPDRVRFLSRELVSATHPRLRLAAP